MTARVMRMTMPNRFKLLALLFLVYSAEGKPKENQRILPIEVVLSPQEERTTSPPVNRLIKGRNKAIELKIQSNNDEDGGKVDLIIAATREVQASERAADRYSPAFNAQLLSDGADRKSNPAAIVSRSWDTSNQDSSLFYPSSHSSEVFPYLSLRQVLQTPQPLFLGQNQFSPLQSFENTLQTQLLPHMNPRLRSYNELSGMGVVMSQPIFTGGVPSNQQGLNSPQIYGLQQGLLSQLQFKPLGLTHQLPSVQNTPVNRYTLLNAAPPKRPDEQNEGSHQNNHAPQKPPQPHNEPSQNQVFRAPQSIPDILGPNRQQLPLRQRPEYTFQGNYQTPAQRNLYQEQQSAHPQQREPHRNIPLPNLGLQDYPNRNAQHNYPINSQDRHLHPNPQQLSVLQHRHLPGIAVGQNVPHTQYRPHNPDLERLNSVQETFRPPLRDLNSRPLAFNQNVPGQGQPNNFPITPFQNGRIPNRAADDRNYPAYNNALDRSRHLPTQNVQQALTHGHPHHAPGLIHQQSSLSPLQEGFAQRPQLYQESSNPVRGAAEAKEQDLNADVQTQSGKYDNDDAAPVVPKRRRKTKKRVPLKEKDNDLEGHSSHQYIIKIG